MINTDLPEKYVKLLGHRKLAELWDEFERETRQKLQEEAECWVSQGQGALLRNFFHACRSGALTYGMTDFAALCTQWEEYFLSGGAFAAFAGQLPNISAVFDKEAEEVKSYLESIHD